MCTFFNARVDRIVRLAWLDIIDWGVGYHYPLCLRLLLSVIRLQHALGRATDALASQTVRCQVNHVGVLDVKGQLLLNRRPNDQFGDLLRAQQSPQHVRGALDTDAIRAHAHPKHMHILRPWQLDVSRSGFGSDSQIQRHGELWGAYRPPNECGRDLVRGLVRWPVEDAAVRPCKSAPSFHNMCHLCRTTDTWHG